MYQPLEDNCAKWLLKIAESEDRTVNLRHLMDFGKEPFEIRILNTNEIVHSQMYKYFPKYYSTEQMKEEIIELLEKREERQRKRYHYILIDCMPSLGTLTINALVAADSVLLPVQAAYLPVKGLQQLIKTISMVKRRLNRRLMIEGILLTIVDFRTNYAKDISSKVRETYGTSIPIFESVIPVSVKAAEASAEGISIYGHCINCKVSNAYKELTQEVLGNGR